MNNFEFEIVMKSFNLEKNDENSYVLGDLSIYHGGRYYAVIKGKTPYDLGLLISEKYDNVEYRIRVNGSSKYEIPFEDVYTYHIDTIEGLIAFIYETKKYYSKEKQDNIEDIINKIYMLMLNNLDVHTTIYDWMQNKECKKDFFKTVLSCDTIIDLKLRNALEEFDSLMNPFCSFNLDNIRSSFLINGFSCNKDKWYSLIDKESKIHLFNSKQENGFVLKLHIPKMISSEVNVYHYFYNGKEIVAFEKFNESESEIIKYNLTDKMVSSNKFNSHLASNIEKNNIIEMINKYINVLKSINDKNIVLEDIILKKTINS